MSNIVYDVLVGGLQGLSDYLSHHVLFCLVPAFFIAGAMMVFVSKEKILKHLGSKSPRYISYPMAVMAGLLLAVCSCTILPLFAGIKKKGAGLGPAMAFLYTAPATNLLAIVYTGGLIGLDFALARIILSVSFAILIGLILVAIFKNQGEARTNKKLIKNEKSSDNDKKSDDNNTPKSEGWVKYRLWFFFIILLAILIIGTRPIELVVKICVVIAIVIPLLVVLKFWFSREEVKNWLRETYGFFKMIFPLLLIGVFIAGMLRILIPEGLIGRHMGSNTIGANLIAVNFGVFMYFPTLVEVPMARMFLDLGMSKGPLLAYLLADPVLSLPSILVVRRIIGNKKTLVFVGLIMVFCTIAGLIYGVFAT